MKKTLLSLLVFCLAGFYMKAQDSSHISYAYPSKYLIGNIRVTGVNFLNARDIIAFTGLSIGQKVSIPGDEISHAIQSLWKQGAYSDVSIQLDSLKGNYAYLTINLKSRPKLLRYSFGGVSKSQSNKLHDEIKLSSNEVVTEQLINRSVQRIKEFYAKKGFSDATVQVERKADTSAKSNREELRFVIDKGRRIKVDKITFSGNQAFTEKKLHRVLKSTKERQWFNVFRNAKYKADEYEDDKEKLITFYRDNGYKDFKIISDSVTHQPQKGVNIGLKLDEGNKYYFRKITWSGNTKYSSPKLSQILGIKKGDVYNQDLLERNLSMNPSGFDITSMYMDSGYLFFSVTPVEVAVENDSVDLEIRIFEGPQAIVNKVTVSGNTRTHDQVVLREIRTRPGQKFSRNDVIRSQRELSQLGVFDPEKMNVVPKPNPKDGTVDIDYVVAEKPTDQVELSGGWGAGRLVGVLGLSLNNFSIQNLFKPKDWQGYPSGDGQRLTIRGQTNGPNFQSYNFSYSDPWFGGHHPNSFTYSAFYSRQQATSTNGQAAILNTPGTSIGIGKRLKWPDDYFTVYGSLAYQYYKYDNYSLIRGYPNGHSNNLYLLGMLKRSSINEPIFPSSGTNITFQVQATLPYSLFSHADFSKEGPNQKYNWLEYHKWKLNAIHFIPLGTRAKKKFTIMTEADFGLIGLYNSKLGYTPFERFYVGGDGLTGYSIAGQEYIRFRGYGSPSDVTPNLYDIHHNLLEEGGLIYNKYTFELRYAITNTPAASIYMLGFLEAANAWNRPKNFDPFTLKRSAGVGIRLFLPMFGLLGFDWGYGFDPALGTNGIPGTIPSGSHFHFFIGQPLF